MPSFTKNQRFLLKQLASCRAPLQITAVLSYRCNFKCKHCFEQGLDSEAIHELSLAAWQHIFTDARRCGARFLNITGGEPLLHPHFCDLYKFAHRLGYSIRVQTNGSLISEEHLELFSNFPPSQIVVSIYGASEATYMRSCGTCRFKKVVEALQNLNRKNINVKVAVTLTSFLTKDLAEIKALTDSLGLALSTHRFLSPAILSNEVNPFQISAFDIVESFKTLGDLQAYQSRKRAQAVAWTSSYKQCLAGRCSCVIMPDGRMAPCQMTSRGSELSVPLSSFKDCWSKLQLSAEESINVETPCAACAFKLLCGKCFPLYEKAINRNCKNNASVLYPLLFERRANVY